jgi:hypothetical protein
VVVIHDYAAGQPWVHAALRVAPNRYFDAEGIVTIERIRERYDLRSTTVVELDRRDLYTLGGFEAAAIARARRWIARIDIGGLSLLRAARCALAPSNPERSLG